MIDYVLGTLQHYITKLRSPVSVEMQKLDKIPEPCSRRNQRRIDGSGRQFSADAAPACGSCGVRNMILR